MNYLDPDDPVAIAIGAWIRAGDVAALTRLLAERPDLAHVRLRDTRGTSRTLLHVAADWPGHFPRGAETVAVLVAAGADVNARFDGTHTETPLHWAASSNDIAVLDALLDAGADIEAPGAVIGGGGPLSDARGFGQWQAAFRLLERGARPTLNDAATLGLLDVVVARLADLHPSAADEAITGAFWAACHGGQRHIAEHLLDRGAAINWVGHGQMTALDIAQKSSAEALVGYQRARELVEWLRARGARPAADLAGARGNR